jgi:hypothetical protein
MLFEPICRPLPGGGLALNSSTTVHTVISAIHMLQTCIVLKMHFLFCNHNCGENLQIFRAAEGCKLRVTNYSENGHWLPVLKFLLVLSQCTVYYYVYS